MEIERTSAARPPHITPADPLAAPASSAPAVSTEGEAAEARRDRIELSPAAREIGAAPDAAREASLVALRAQIDAGTYRVDADGIARVIVAREDV